MTTLLHLSAAGRQYWSRTRQGWQPLAGEPDNRHPVWVVTDLAEESFAEIETPRLYGRDRRDLIERQLATRFPDTPYRCRLDVHHGGKLTERLVPTRYTLFGITAADKLNAEFDAKGISIAALCPTSLLLAHIGLHKQLPADLFVVLPSAAGLRIVFLKNRIPVLTRLAPIPDQVKAQAEEIIRTHRYLENVRTIQRGSKPPPVLILGKAAEFAEPLGAARLELIAPPSPWNVAHNDWRLPLFDLAIREQPYGQLAPVERRTLYLAQRLRKSALIAAALSLVAGVTASGLNVRDIFDIQREQELDQATARRLNGELATIEQRIAAVGVTPELMRRAVDLNARELESAPALDQQLRQVGQVLAGEGQTRIASLEWRLLATGARPCVKQMLPASGTAPATEPPADATSAQSAERKVELVYEAVLAAGITPRAKAQTLRDISARLTQIPGAMLLLDPAKELVKGTLRGGGGPAGEDERNITWCLTLPGVTGNVQQSDGKARSNPP